MTIYQEIILDHYHHPHNYGEVDQPDADVSLTNSSCGDKIRLTLKVENDIIQEIAFSAVGCAISMASASILTDHVKGMTTQKVRALDTETLLDLIGIELSPSRIRCALLPLEALSKAVQSLKES
ncbi:SUF system NifU family Fe-S cluster assembly protein [Candidatus Woesebacteria bacterium]|jgi:nitrogen fixation NifU-like protein|nr:SUF system NifU family Fe-S cluster assembly protein [Candidatus Woesebacteria bacterium]